MEAVKFKEANLEIAKDQDEYLTLPALKLRDAGEVRGEIITCWRANFFERLKILFTGRVWLSMWTFNKPVTPVRMDVHRKKMYLTYDEAMKKYPEEMRQIEESWN